MQWGLKSLIPLTVCLLMLQCQAFIFREIIVNEPLTLPCTCSRNGSVAQWTRFIPNKGVIAKGWMCHSKLYSGKRFTLSGDTCRGDFTLMISSVAYSDAGSYRCSCNGESVTEVKLKVLVPTVIKALEGQSITLPCYGDTHRDIKDVKWKKDGQKVLLYTHASRSGSTDEGSGSRVMMSVEGILLGDLSLNITSVQLSDAGLYQCLLHDESQDGEPAAVLLKVKEQPELPTTCNAWAALLGMLLGSSVLANIVLVIFIIMQERRVTRNDLHSLLQKIRKISHITSLTPS